MSKEIDPDEIAAGALSYEDAKYLADRGKLPKGYEMPDPPDVDDDGEPDPPKSRVTPLEDQDTIVIGAKGGIVGDDGEEEYIVGWNNDQRRAELSGRGLSVNGGKDELIARLRRSDAGNVLDDDLTEVG